jgi:hypothetical protein
MTNVNETGTDSLSDSLVEIFLKIKNFFWKIKNNKERR